ncbi:MULTISPECIES: hypothetical protein [Clostridia]|jgi:hypothetical protein|uniref:hypothetical protein n=1 Tax=Clostridia TaxID=186801 RepID=UPI000E4AB3F5|nr:MULTISPECIES: hypothetical protein [Clostridia]RHP24362.1 hypothetical protein DWZ63_10425 [Clostridium sp. AF34-13]
MANFVFKETKQKSMKIAGIIDTDSMIVEVDGEEKKLVTLLSVFNGSDVEINVKVKEESELDEPTESNEE